MITIKLDGLDEVVRRMKALPAAIAGNKGGPIRKALYAGAKLVRDAAKENAPVKTGALRDAIILYRDRNPAAVGANEHYSVGVRKIKINRKVARLLRRIKASGKTIRTDDTFYWRFAEFGTSKQAAKPFMRPAIDNNVGAVTEAITSTFTAEVDKAVASLGGRIE